MVRLVARYDADRVGRVYGWPAVEVIRAREDQLRRAAQREYDLARLLWAQGVRPADLPADQPVPPPTAPPILTDD